MPKKTTVNIDLIKQATLTKLANKRQATSATKTRGEVRGGGKKPWRQKGTGRARAGSSRSPIWVGGGKVFGPNKDRNFKARLPKRMHQAAFRELLMLRQPDIKVVASLALKELKTKAALALLKKHDLTGELLLVTEKVQPELLVATNNLPNVAVTTTTSLSIGDLMSTRTVVMEQAVFNKYFPAQKSRITTKKSPKTEVAQ